MNEETAKKLIQYITAHMERESVLLQPNPQVFMNDPYGLLRLIQAEAKLSDSVIDGFMLEAQKKG